MILKSTFSLSIGAVAALATLTACQGGGSGAENAGTGKDASFAAIVKERQANFKAISKANKAAKAAAEGDTPDFAAIAKAATSMSADGAKIGGHFPAGSGTESGEKTEALASIWAKPDEFRQATDKFLTATTGLKAAADAKDADAVAKAIKDVGATCKECHKAFREDKK